MMKIYGDAISGNCLKVKWTADWVKLPYAWVDIDIMKGESRTADYLAKFPQGQVPGVAWPDGRRLAQSNAIIRYLARGSKLLPDDGFTQAQIDEWLFWEQYSHEPYVATVRFQALYQKKVPDAWRVERGDKALDFLDTALADKPFLVDGRFSIADIALVAYTRFAPEGGFDLQSRQHLTRWIAACEAQLGLSPLASAA